MKVNTKAHGQVDVLFHVCISSESTLRVGNFRWQVGAFSTLEKAMEAANAYIKEAVPFNSVSWELDDSRDGWKPIESGIVTMQGRRHKMTWKLDIRYAILDTRTHHNGQHGWNWVHFNPDPTLKEFLARDLENLEDKQ